MATRRNHSGVSLALIVILIAGFGTTSGAVEFAGGMGTLDDPYQIATAGQLISIGANEDLLDKHFLLLNDIDLDPNLPGGGVFDASVIAQAEYRVSGGDGTRRITIVSRPFRGTFDGRGRAIRNLVIEASSEVAHQVGLFGSVGGRGFVTNLRVKRAHVSGSSLVGILVGTNSGTVSNCHVEGVAVASGHAGGVIGSNHGFVVGCKSTASVAGGSILGGLVGSNYRTVASSYAVSRISFLPISGQTELRASGGLVGYNAGDVDLSYAVSVAAEMDHPIGGLVGENSACVYLSYWDAQATGISSSGGGRAKTTTQMMDIDTFLGWGQGGLWAIDEGRDYPRLRWENTPGARIVDPPNGYAGGTGKADAPYRIITAEQFVSIAYYRDHYSRHFVLQNDIDLRHIDPDIVYPIGTTNTPFTGTFDGNHHTIAHFTLPADNNSHVGVFGYVSMKFPPLPEIRALHLTGLNVQGAYQTGGLAGTVMRGSIRQCSVSGIVSGYRCVGGLIGDSRAQIVACLTEGLVVGEACVGGLTGRHSAGELITSCYSSADVSADREVGGLIGENRGGIVYCYATGQVAGVEDVGGLIGASDGGTAYLSYWDAEVNAHLDDRAGQGRTTRELMQPETFRGWGVPGEWTLNDGADYPRMAWENFPGAPLTVPAQRYGGGTGEPDDPYQIRTPEQFRDIAYYAPDWTSHFALMADIDLAGIAPAEILPVGNALYPFKGTFDGNHRTITGFHCIRPDIDNVGLFGVLDHQPQPVPRAPTLLRPTGIVRRLHARAVRIEGRDRVGGLVALNAGTVTECSATGGIAGRGYVGGLIGSNHGTAGFSYAIADVDGTSQVGGLVGSNHAVVESSYARGTVAGWREVGGLLGVHDRRTELTTSYAAVHIDLQGIAADDPAIRYMGGLIGRSEGSIHASVWDTEVSGTHGGVGNQQPDPAGVVGVPTSSMQSAATYASLLWDFESVWMICEGREYPRLRWELVECETGP
jgi:mucin-19